MNPRSDVLPIPKIAVGDNGRFVVNEYVSVLAEDDSQDFHYIAVGQPSGTSRVVDTVPLTDPRLALSRQTGITGDGEFFAYVSWNHAGDVINIGQTAEGQPFSIPAPVFTTDNVIGIAGDAAHTPIRMESIDLASISIIRHNKNDDSLIEGDTFWVSFMATPTGPSRSNPRAPTKPLLFRETLGIWMLRVDVQRGTDGNLLLNASGPLPVVHSATLTRGTRSLSC